MLCYESWIEKEVMRCKVIFTDEVYMCVIEKECMHVCVIEKECVHVCEREESVWMCVWMCVIVSVCVWVIVWNRNGFAKKMKV